MSARRQQVCAIVRLDLEANSTDPNWYVQVVEVLPEWSQAEAEVKRLNALNGQKNYVYFAQSTRWFPDGREIIGVTT